jgi:hypothetical protein
MIQTSAITSRETRYEMEIRRSKICHATPLPISFIAVLSKRVEKKEEEQIA